MLDGLEVRVAFGNVWKESLSELSGGQRYVMDGFVLLSTSSSTTTTTSRDGGISHLSSYLITNELYFHLKKVFARFVSHIGFTSLQASPCVYFG